MGNCSTSFNCFIYPNSLHRASLMKGTADSWDGEVSFLQLPQSCSPVCLMSRVPLASREMNGKHFWFSLQVPLHEGTYQDLFSRKHPFLSFLVITICMDTLLIKIIHNRGSSYFLCTQIGTSLKCLEYFIPPQVCFNCCLIKMLPLWPETPRERCKVCIEEGQSRGYFFP